MDQWEFKEAVHRYKMKSGHAINYYDGGYSSTDTGSPLKRQVQKGSLAKDKMRDVLGNSDKKSNGSKKRRNVTGFINDTP